MFLPNLKNTDIVAFIGKDGVSILSKALEKVFVETHYDAGALVKSLHLKTRCLMAWLENISKNEKVFAQIPLTQVITDTKYQELTISFLKDETIINKRELSRFGMGKTIEVVDIIKSTSLPEIASHLLALEQFQDEMNENEFFNSTELNKTIQVLVDSHMEFLKKSVKLNLDKSEATSVCPDCHQGISLSTNASKLCICYKWIGNNSIHIEKNDKNGLTLHFGKKWDKDNISLFSRALKNKLK